MELSATNKGYYTLSVYMHGNSFAAYVTVAFYENKDTKTPVHLHFGG